MSAGGSCDSAVIDSRYKTRAAARYPWRVDLRLDPFFSREAASQGGMTVSGVQAQGVVWESMRPCGAIVLHSRDDCAPLFRSTARFVNLGFTVLA
jgi:hypothetical protein